MSASIAFLTGLSRIADEAASDVARAAAVRALVGAYQDSLYDRLGIAAGCRPTRVAKQEARDALHVLRLAVFRAELAADAGPAALFATARQHIEMARRALDLRIVEDEPPDAAGVPPLGSSPAPRNNRGFIRAMHQRLHDRRAIVASWEAIRQSHDLLARCGTPSPR